MLEGNQAERIFKGRWKKLQLKKLAVILVLNPTKQLFQK
jgi:hypothetical protein